MGRTCATCGLTFADGPTGPTGANQPLATPAASAALMLVEFSSDLFTVNFGAAFTAETRETLGNMLGLTDDEIDRIRDAWIVYCDTRGLQPWPTRPTGRADCQGVLEISSQPPAFPHTGWERLRNWLGRR